MLIPTPARILLARDPVDFRKSIDGLAAVCEVHLGERPLDGTLFAFVNRRRDGLKMLVWTHGGFLMLYKKLEKGRFLWPVLGGDRGTVTPAELAAESARHRSPLVWQVVQDFLAGRRFPLQALNHTA